MTMNRLHKVWKRILSLSLVLMLILTTGCLSAAAEASKKNLTVMYYICGADLERDNGQFSALMGEVMATRYNQDAVNAVGLLGGTPRWAGRAFDPSVLNIVEIAGRRPTKVDEMPLAPMSDSATLTKFMDYCQEHYPAEHYILVICDHGGGPLLGCCVDHLFEKSSLSLAGLSKGLADSVFANRGLDTIAFNACLMGSAEIANCLAPFAQYMVATEDAMYGISNDWLKDVEKDATPLETARRIAETTYQKNKTIIAKQKASELNSVSVIDLQTMATVVTALSDYFAGMPALDASTFTAVSNHRRDAVDFGVLESGGNSQYDLVDIGSLVTKLEADNPDAAALLEAIQKAVAYNYSDVEGCAGMTVYYPYLNKAAAEKYLEVYASLGFAPAYVNYIIQYVAIMTGTPLAKWEKLMVNVPGAQKDNRVLFILGLTDEQMTHLGNSRMDVLLKEEDGSYRFSYLTLDTTLNEDAKTITGEYSGTALYAVDAEGNALTKPLPYRMTDNGTYVIPADMTLKAEEDAEPVTQKALLYCELVKDGDNKNLVPTSVAVWEDGMQTWTRSFDADLSKYTNIAVAMQTRKETRKDDILLPFDQWDLGTDETWSAAMDGSWSFRLLNDTLDLEKLYVAFEVQDSQSNLYLSELYQIKNPGPEPVTTVEYDDANLVKIGSLSVSPQKEQNQLLLSAEVINLTETEAVITPVNIAANGEAIEAAVGPAYGSGENWGLLKDEKQMVTITIPLDKLADLTTKNIITFDLELSNAADSTAIGTVPVTVTMTMKE